MSSSENLNKFGAVILSAGKGTRLGCVDCPKVMLSIGGKPIVSYIVETLKKIGFSKEQIILVVGFKQEKVREYFGDSVSFVVQEDQKGTAHAAYVGMKQLPENISQALILNGDDTAFYKENTVIDFIDSHLKSNAVLSLLSVELSDPSLYGRILRHQDGRMEIIEKEYLTEEQKQIKEVSTGTFCFDRQWFEKMFPTMPPLRKLGEFGLPTALAMANKEGLLAQVVKIRDNAEWFGVNTPGELEMADHLSKIKQSRK